MFRLSRALLLTGHTSAKITTHIAGVDVVPNARAVLISMYRRIVDSVVESQYKDVFALQDQANIAKYHLTVLSEITCDEAAARELDVTHLEQLIVDCEVRMDSLEATFQLLEKFSRKEITVNAQEYKSNRAPMFGSDEYYGKENRHAYPADVIADLATGKLSAHEGGSKPLSLAYIKWVAKHATEEEVAAAEAAVASMTDAEKAQADALLKKGRHEVLAEYFRSYFIKDLNEFELDKQMNAVYQ